MTYQPPAAWMTLEQVLRIATKLGVTIYRADDDGRLQPLNPTGEDGR